MSHLCSSNAHPDSFLYKAEEDRRFAILLTKLEALVQAYENLGERLQRHLDNQCEMYTIESDEKQRAMREWVAEYGEPELSDPIILTRRYQFRELMGGTLAAVHQATTKPNPYNWVQTAGAPKNHVVRLAVRDLIEIFEKATGVAARIYANQYSTGGYGGNFCEFAIACLSPLNLIAATHLPSAILSAYKEKRRGVPVRVPPY